MAANAQSCHAEAAHWQAGCFRTGTMCRSLSVFPAFAFRSSRTLSELLLKSRSKLRGQLSEGLSYRGFKNDLSSLWLALSSRSALLSRPGRGFEIRIGFGLKTRFHTASCLEGHYVCASPVIEDDLEEEYPVFEENAIDEESCNLAEERGRIFGPVLNVAEVNFVNEESESAIDQERGNAAVDDLSNLAEEQQVWVVNFYHFADIEDPHQEVARHASFLDGKDVRGRIYISHQGINAQLSGPGKAAIEYGEWVKEDPRFSTMLVQISPAFKGHAFPRLRLRYKPSLVQVEGGTLHLPITDPSARAVHLSPAEWTQRLDAAKIVENNHSSRFQELADNPASNGGRPVVLLDVRNGYEWDVGHFKGAQRPSVDCFKSTEYGLTGNELASSDPLMKIDKDAVDVMMYCTGGIRCDVFSTMLRQKGFKNLYTLRGGVSNYLKEEGPRNWAGNLFVFDSRLAVSPKVYHTEESTDLECVTAGGEDSTTSSLVRTFARCWPCGDTIADPLHRNCANLDCNILHMSCPACVSRFKGCCSESCSSAPRLRPLLVRQQYERWHNYRPDEPNSPMPAGYVSRRALNRRRRRERKKLKLGNKTDVESHVSSI